MKTTDELREFLDAVLYGDLFDCAVTVREIHNFGRRKIDETELRALLDEFVAYQVIEEHDGYFHLPGRAELAARRPHCIERAKRLQTRARRVAKWLRHVPFIRGLYLTGSVAADHAEADADVDLLIVVADGRLASAFVQLAPLSRLLTRGVFCPNFYLCETRVQRDRRSHYVAREIAQARPLLGEGNALVDGNAWIRELLPNLRTHGGGASAGSMLQRFCELPLRGRVGQTLEARARAVAVARLEKHYGDRNWQVPEAVRREFEEGSSLRFHASNKIRSLADEHEARRHAIEPALARMHASRSKGTR